MLYLRMFVTLAISFYTSRVVLQALGVSDYGIYNVVGGVIVMIGTITGALGSATSRFLTFSLGMNDPDNLKTTFSTAFYIHLALALLFLLVAETVGLWFVNTQLVIPEGRMGAANWAYQSAIISTALGITQVPYSASITSHERMGAFAYIAIANAVLKLGMTFLVLVSSFDHLILYSILYMLLSVAFQVYYRFYCIRNFEECHIAWRFDKGLFKQMMSFSGWTMYGSVSLTISQQGTNILINRFFGTIINAAVGVAGQVQGILYAFTGNIPVAFNPQITKSYAAADYGRVNELIGMGTKLTATVTILMTVPVMFNLDYLMSLWLEEVPYGAVGICEILLIRNVFNSFNPFVNCAINASGKIRNINIFFSTLYLIALLISYVVLKLTHSFVIMYIVGSLSSMISVFVYLITLKKYMPSFESRRFLKETYLPLMIIYGLSCAMSYAISLMSVPSLVKLLVITMASASFVVLSSFYLVMDKNMRYATIGLLKSKFQKQAK